MNISHIQFRFPKQALAMSLSSHVLLRCWYSHAQDELKAIFRSQTLPRSTEVPGGVTSAGYVLDVLARSSRPEKRLHVSEPTRLVGQEVGSEDLAVFRCADTQGFVYLMLVLPGSRRLNPFRRLTPFCYSCSVGSTKAAGRTRFWELLRSSLLSLSLLACWARLRRGCSSSYSIYSLPDC
jgi:hypothetical protein